MHAPTPAKPMLIACSASVSVTAFCAWLVIRQLRVNHRVIHKHMDTTRAYENAVADLAIVSRRIAQPPSSPTRSEQAGTTAG